MSFRDTSLAAGFFICGLAGLAPAIAPSALYAAGPAKPSITPEATAAIEQMEKSLSRGNFSFEGTNHPRVRRP